jgi:aminoglycoside 3-N-acetyltransferase
MVEKILSINPWIEVFVKWIYWHSSGLRKILRPMLKKIRRSSPKKSIESESIEELKLLLNDFKIKDDDILIVHSSFVALGLTSTTPEQLLNYLVSEVVPRGTIVLPAMPIMKYNDGGITEYPGDPNRVAVFDLKKSPPWTGVLPQKLAKYPNSNRWVNPINNIIAFGHHANEMMTQDFFNINQADLFPCGKGSPWEYMVKKNAKILSLGTDLTHSLTMIHFAEDIKGRKWPIDDWYHKRKFIIRFNTESHEVTLNERKPRWAINFAERTLQKDLLGSGLLKSKRFNGVKIEFLTTSDLMNFLNARNANGYPYFTLKSKK